MNRLAVALSACAGLFCLTPTPAAGTVVEPVLYSGQAMPGGSGGTVVPLPYLLGFMSRNGVVAVEASAETGSGSLNTFLMTYDHGQTRVLLDGAVATDSGGSPVAPSFWQPLAISPDGRYVAAPVDVNPVNGGPSNDIFLWDLRDGSGQPAPVIQNATGNHLATDNISGLTISNTGTYSVTVSHDGSLHLYAGDSTRFDAIATTNTPLPDPGRDPVAVGNIATKPDGTVLFAANTDNYFSNTGVYLGSTDGAIERLAAPNDPAPGIGNAWFADIVDVHGLSDDGRMAFHAAVIGPGMATTSDEGIWVGSSAGSLKLMVREGTRAPGDSRDFADFDTIQINAAGQVAFRASLGAPSFEENSLWVSDPANSAVTKLVEVGQPAPGTDSNFEYIGKYSLSDTGEVVFQGVLPPASPLASQTFGLWIGRPGGDIRLLMLAGDQFQLNGDWVTVDRITLPDWTPSAITDDGQVLAEIGYHLSSDASGTPEVALVLLSVPEPSTPLLLLASAGLVCRKRRG